VFLLIIIEVLIFGILAIFYFYFPAYMLLILGLGLIPIALTPVILLFMFKKVASGRAHQDSELLA